jgi:hypothetical protein
MRLIRHRRLRIAADELVRFPQLLVIEIAYALGLFMPPQVLLASPKLAAGGIAQHGRLWIAGHEPPLFPAQVSAVSMSFMRVFQANVLVRCLTIEAFVTRHMFN